MKLAENIMLLPIMGMGTVNLVLAWDNDHAVLIDAGFPGQADDIIHAIEAAGLTVGDLTHLFITHQDWDHIGCVADLQKLAPNLRVMAHEEEAPYIDGRVMPIKLAARLADYDNLTSDMQARVNQQKAMYENEPITIHEKLQDGTVLPMCGGIQVIHTPGHTPGHMVLLFQRSGIMVCGDACNIKDSTLTGSNPVFTYDMPQAEASLTKIKSFAPSGIVAYHGGYLPMNGGEL